MTRRHTTESGETVMIEWERGSFIDYIEYSAIYTAEGQSEDGRKWGAGWEECGGGVELTEIEVVEDPRPQFIIDTMKSAVGHDYFYFDEPIEVGCTRIYGVAISPEMRIYVMTPDLQWYEADDQVLPSLYLKVKSISLHLQNIVAV